METSLTSLERLNSTCSFFKFINLFTGFKKSECHILPKGIDIISFSLLSAWKLSKYISGGRREQCCSFLKHIKKFTYSLSHCHWFCPVFNKTFRLTNTSYSDHMFWMSFLCWRKLSQSFGCPQNGFALYWVGSPHHPKTFSSPNASGPYLCNFRSPFFHPFHPNSALSNIFGARKAGLEKGKDEAQSGPVWESRKSFSGLLLARALRHVETLLTLFSV